MKKVFEFSIQRPLLVNLATVFILLAGVLAFININRDAFPNVNFNSVLITTAYNGAGPREVEKLVTIPLERELKEVNDIREMRSISIENLSIIVMEIEEDIADTQKVVNDIQRAVDQADDLPLDLEDDPNVREIQSRDTPVVEIAISGELSESELIKHAKRLEDKLLDLPNVAMVSRKGWRDREIWVNVDPNAVTQYWISLSQIVSTLKSSNVNIPGGRLKEPGKEYLIRTSNEFENADSIKKVVLRASDSGHWIAVKDIASVEPGFEEETIINRTNGTRSINLVIIKKERGDAINVVEQVRTLVEDYQKIAPNELDLSLVNDFSFYVKRRLKVLYTNGSIGFILIMIALFIFMTPRIAIVTSIGIPISLFTAIFIMYTSGITLNLITMFGLITVLGMLVDDAVVVAENCYRYIEKGMPSRQASLKGVMEVWKPVTASVLTTVSAFLPLMFMAGEIGKFVKYIPIMVMIALFASLLEVYLVLPSHLAELESIPRIKFLSRFHLFKWDRQKAQERLEHISLIYREFIRSILHKRYYVLGLIGALLIFGGWLFVKIPFVLFPSRGVEIFFVRGEAKVGTPLEDTAKLFEEVEAMLGNVPAHEIDDYVLQVGIQQNDPNDPFTERFSHIGQIVVYLSPPTTRDRNADEIIESLRPELNKISGFENLVFDKVNPGPPVGKPIAIRVRGEDIPTLTREAQKIADELATINGVKDIKIDISPGKEEFHVNVDYAKAAKAQLTTQDVGLAVRAAFDGLVATTIKKTDEEIDVRVRYPESVQTTQETFQKIRIPNASGGLVALSSIASFTSKPGISSIRHYERKRAVTVSASVDEAVTTSVTVNQIMKKRYANWEASRPGYNLLFSGEFEKTEESLASLKMAFLLGALLIFIILAGQFNSLWQPLVVMSAIPLGFVGVLFAFWLHGEPKSFLAMLGAVGLAGVVINNAIVLVDFINNARAAGMDKIESIVEAGHLRLRPVLLTSVTTVLGLISLAYGLWGSDPFLQPMALVFVWGIAFATLLTLLIIPCLHAIADDCLARCQFLKFWNKEDAHN